MLELLTRKWPESENRKQLSALVGDRRDTPIGCAEGIAKRVNPDGYRDYKACFLDPWKHWKDYVYDSVSDEIINTKSLVARTRKGFDLKYSKNKPTAEKEKGTETVAPSVYTIQRCPEVAGKEYAPSEARPTFTHSNGENMLNTYHPVKYENKPDPENIEKARTLLTNHIAHMFTEPEEQEILIDYLAWCVQNPGKLKPWMVILYGVQGDGKSWFRELVEAALGEENVGVLQSSNLEDQFACPAYGKCMTFIEELKLDNVRKYDTLERLKSLLGNRRVSIREMRKAPREVGATANYLAATNHSDSLPVSDNERRFCVLTSQWVNRKPELRRWVSTNPGYYRELYRAVREKPEAFREALLRHRVSDSFLDTHEAPRTQGTLRMIDEAVSAGAVELGEWISDWESVWINDQFVVLKALKEKHSEESDTHYRSTSGITPQKMPPTKKLSRFFQELGYTAKEQRSVRLSRGMDNRKENVTIYLKPEADPDAAFESYKTREEVKTTELG